MSKFIGLKENPTKGLTKHENLKELQELLVQTCIDYIKENHLDDIEDIQFSIDCIQDSVKEGEWVSTTDSFISIEGLDVELYDIDGEIIEMPSSYKIDERY